MPLYWACDYLSVLGFKLNHVSKRGHWSVFFHVMLWLDGSQFCPCLQGYFIGMATIIIWLPMYQCSNKNMGNTWHWDVDNQSKANPRKSMWIFHRKYHRRIYDIDIALHYEWHTASSCSLLQSLILFHNFNIWIEINNLLPLITSETPFTSNE